VLAVVLAVCECGRVLAVCFFDGPGSARPEIDKNAARVWRV